MTFQRNPRRKLRRNSDESFRRLRAAWLSSRTPSEYLPYKRACERAGLEPEGECSQCGGEYYTACSTCGEQLCDNCYLECEVCEEAIGNCHRIECDNCDHFTCEMCSMPCKGCKHNHKLCADENCNEDEEFIKKCDECLFYFCLTCSDNCYREHRHDCLSYRRNSLRHNPHGRHPDNKCATPTCSAEGTLLAFVSSTQCKRCYRRKRSYAVLGRSCTSCGWTDADYAKVGKPYGKCKSLCNRCSNWRVTQRPKRKWPVMCVSGQHVVPPPRTAFSASTPIHTQPRDFPACNCYVNDEGVVVLDPEIRRIPLEDEADPSRGYIPVRERFRDFEDRSDPGESRERSQSPGHGPYEGDAPFDPTGRKGSSGESPRRTTRGGSPFDIGPRRPRDARRLRRYRRHNPRGYHPDNDCETCEASGVEHFFANSNQCRRCYSWQHRHHRDNDCATPC